VNIAIGVQERGHTTAQLGGATEGGTGVAGPIEA
jgi:hypothetical protein